MVIKKSTLKLLCPKIEFIFQFKKSKALKNKSIYLFFYFKGGYVGALAPDIKA